ncbi:glycosyltransferase family 39 protein [Labilibacter sediminis]|nr:glycosyltransferase family 39 protein [Labilibacter sediminis]
MSGLNKLIIGFIAVYILRLIISLSMGIMPQDAYYYFYSEHLALSYFDHPPMIAYFIKLFTSVLGSSDIVVKLTDFMVTLMSYLSFFYLGKIFIPKERLQNAMLLYGSTILLTVLSMNTTPDVPLILFWTLSLITLYKSVFEDKLLYWIISGVLIGLAFDSKYTALFLIIGLICFLILSKKYRHFLFSKELFLMLVFFALAVSPIFIWNINNDWISFKFQSSERADSIMQFKIKWNYFFGNIATQFILLLPVLFVGVVTILFKHIKKVVTKWKLPSDRVLFLLSFSAPIILFFFAISLIYWVKLNWMMPAYVSAIILVTIYLKQKWVKHQIIVSLVLHVLLLAQVLFYIVPIHSDDTWYGWKKLKTEVETLKTEYPDHFIFSRDGYKTTAVLNFYLDEKIYARNVIGEHALQYSIIDNDLKHLDGKSALFIDSDKKVKHINKSGKTPKVLVEHFDKIIELDPILIKDKKGKTQRKFYVYECTNYRSPE